MRSSDSLLGQVIQLSRVSERPRAIRKLSERLGAETFLVFLRDAELKLLLPAPGFAQTLSNGKSWRAFMEMTLANKSYQGEVVWNGKCRPAYGIANDGAAIVLIGVSKPTKGMRELGLLLPLLAAALEGERAAASALAQANIARELSIQSNDLARRFDEARRAAEREVAARGRAEDEVRRANQTLENRVRERTQSLTEALGQLEEFSYTVSHDLRAPLRAMEGFAHILIEDFSGQLAPEGRNYLARILNSSRRMNQLTNDLLSFTRVSRADFPLSPVSIDELLQELAMHFRDTDRRARLEVKRPLGVVIANHALLSQCLNNLIENAVKYVRPGEEPKVEVWVDKNGPVSRLLVKDNGSGIPEQHHQRIFKIFERLDSEKPGTGVGLAIVKRAVDRMNGKVGVISKQNLGSTFWIELPNRAEAAVQPTS